MPSYLAVDIAIAVSGSAWQNDVNAGLPASRARITPFKRGISAMLFPCREVDVRILTEANPGLTTAKSGSYHSSRDGTPAPPLARVPKPEQQRQCHDHRLPRPLHDRAERPAAMAQGAGG